MPSGDTACQQVLPTSGDLPEQGTQPTGGREGHEIPGGMRWPPSRPAPPGGPSPPWAPALPASTRVASPGGTQRPQSHRPHGSLGVWRPSPRWEGRPGLVDPRLNLRPQAEPSGGGTSRPVSRPVLSWTPSRPLASSPRKWAWSSVPGVGSLPPAGCFHAVSSADGRASTLPRGGGSACVEPAGTLSCCSRLSHAWWGPASSPRPPSPPRAPAEASPGAAATPLTLGIRETASLQPRHLRLCSRGTRVCVSLTQSLARPADVDTRALGTEGRDYMLAETPLAEARQPPGEGGWGRGLWARRSGHCCPLRVPPSCWPARSIPSGPEL